MSYPKRLFYRLSDGRLELNILVVGFGGREHALCWSISSSPLVDALYCAPGNGGIGNIANRIDISPTDIDGLIGFCRSESIDLVVVGPEQPLVDGLIDHLCEAGIKAFGPSAKAARLEGSKGFTKDLCAKYNIPTGAYGRFTQAEAAKSYVLECGTPIVVKADGLAAGKGVTVAQNITEAMSAIDQAFAGRFGSAGHEVVVEEFLDGEEVSFFAIVDGRTALPLASAQDHKAVGDGDTGPNTGGMGAYSPAPVVTEELHFKIMSRIIEPTVAAMTAEGSPYIGVLYAGIMIVDGEPLLLEYNARFGDPECQVLMPRLKSDLMPALLAASDGILDQVELRWHEDVALTVVLATKGYPGEYKKGTIIRNVDSAEELPGITIFHAGTDIKDGNLIATGGRVLNVTALGNSVLEAQERAYEAVDVIDWPDGFCRSDIGWRAISRES
jgi:phosphoribosylamine--glycine ligase